jgi:hypothetical protein
LARVPCARMVASGHRLLVRHRGQAPGHRRLARPVPARSAADSAVAGASGIARLGALDLGDPCRLLACPEAPDCEVSSKEGGARLLRGSSTSPSASSEDDPGRAHDRWVPKSGFAWGPAIREGGRRSPRVAARAVATVRASYAAGRSLGLSGCSSLRTGSRGEGSSLGSLASRCAVSQHPVVRGIEAEPPPPGAAAPARVGMPSALFGRVVISWESPGRPRPIRSPGRSSAGTAAMSPSPDSSSAERTGARPSPVLLVCSNRSRSPSPAWDAMAPCSGREGLPICICGQVALPGTREPPTECERAGTKVGPGNEGGRRCRRRCRRRMRRQARRPRLDLWRLGGLR